MRYRPLCMVWIALMVSVWLLKMVGAPIFGKPDLTPRAEERIRSEDSLALSGTIQSRSESASSMQYILCHVSMSDGSGILLSAGDRPVEIPRLLVITEKENVFPIGSVVRCSGDVERIEAPGNPGQFDARSYYESKGIYYSVWTDRILLRKKGGGISESLSLLKNRLVIRLRDSLPKETAGVLADMIFGEKILLDDETRRNFQAGQLSHALCISGMHISCLGLGIYIFLQKLRLPVPAAAAAASSVMTFYCAMIGNPSSAVRALIMFAVMMGARISRRSYDLVSALSLAGILLLLTSPGSIFLPGFQLSFAAVIGIGVVYPLARTVCRFECREKRGKHRLPEYFRKKLPDAVLSYLSVLSVTLPLTAYYFYEISLLGLLCNLLVVPLIEYILIFGVAGSLSFLISSFLARIVLFPCSVVLSAVDFFLSGLRKIPGVFVVCGQPDLSRIVLYYVVLSAALILLERREKNRRNPDKKKKSAFTKAAPALAAVMIATALFLLFSRKEADFSLTMLDVGQGDCLVIREGQGGTFLMDGGSSDVKHVGKYRILPYLKSQRITRVDGIFLSHDDGDHINGAEELLALERDRMAEIHVGAVYMPDWMKEDGKKDDAQSGSGTGTKERKSSESSVRRIKELCREMRIPVRYLHAGMQIQSGKLNFRVLHPFSGRGFREGNEGSMVLLMNRGGFRTLFTGDLEGQGESELLPYLGDVDCLKVAHHGSKSSTSEEFLRRTRPEICLISAPEKSRYGHPHRDVLRRIRKEGAVCLVTRDCGAVTIEERGRKRRITVFFEQFRESQGEDIE